MTAFRASLSRGTLATMRQQVEEEAADPERHRIVLDPYGLSPDRGAEPEVGPEHDLRVMAILAWPPRSGEGDRAVAVRAGNGDIAGPPGIEKGCEVRIYVTSVFVDEREKALDFYTNILGFQKKADIPSVAVPPG